MRKAVLIALVWLVCCCFASWSQAAMLITKGSSGNYRTMFAQTSDPSWPAQAGRPRLLCGQHCKSWVARLRGP